MKQPYTPRLNRKFIGGYRPRIDGWEKASGQAEYADDIATQKRFPGLLYARVLRSPYPHARIKSIDVSLAEKLPGVVKVMTYQDPEFADLRPTNAGWTDGVDTVTYDRMMWRKYRDRRVLGDYACWTTDEVGAVVAAESEEIADEAIRLIKVDWEVLPFVLDPIEAMKPGAPLLHPEISKNNVMPPDEVGGEDVFLNKGDVEADFAKAEIVVDGTSVHHNATQASMDNWCCLVDWTTDKLVVYSNSYEADQCRMHVSEMLGLPLHKVNIISGYVGGQFGRADTGAQPFFLFTAILSKATGRPVKFKHTRRESFHDSRQPAIYYGKVGAKKDGTITSMYFKSIGNAGAYADHTIFALKFAPLEISEVTFAHIPNIKLEAYGVYTNKLPGCMMRGVGNSQFNLILGHMVDLLADKLDMDPIDLCIKNFGHEWGSLPDKSLKEVLTQGADKLGWKEKRHQPGQGPTYENSKKRGVGFSFHPAWHAEWQELRRGRIPVRITLNPDCTVILDAPTVEIGTGSNTCNVLGCAEALSFLGIAPEDIHSNQVVNTETSLKDCVQTDSSVSYLQSEVLAVAARELKKKILERAEIFLETKAKDLDIVDGRIFVKSKPDQGMTLKEMFMVKDDLVPLTVYMSRLPSDKKTGVPYFANFAEVEVDTDTGRVDVLHLVVINDCGTVMFASGAEGQQVGGQVMGLGEVLTEEIIYDEATGFPLNFNLIDYKIPTMADMPEIDPILLEVWKGAGEFGACGIGEGTLTCTPRAVMNAIYNATGVRINDIPVKPEKVLRALGKV